MVITPPLEYYNLYSRKHTTSICHQTNLYKLPAVYTRGFDVQNAKKLCPVYRDVVVISIVSCGEINKNKDENEYYSGVRYLRFCI